jgi:hypothetical protein
MEKTPSAHFCGQTAFLIEVHLSGGHERLDKEKPLALPQPVVFTRIQCRPRSAGEWLHFFMLSHYLRVIPTKKAF